MKISFSGDKSIRDILGSHFFKIPRFQRPYSWDRENVEDFWTDALQSPEEDYFIGSMVVYKEAENMFGVVDGQQRLTTITMLLCALRNMLAKHKLEDMAQGVHTLIQRPDIVNKQTLVLRTETSYPYFQEHIQKFGKPEMEVDIGPEENALKDAFEYLNERLQDRISGMISDKTIKPEHNAAAVKNDLMSIRDKVLNLTVIFVALSAEDDAYLIFETLNTRGKDLNVADLVKNYLARLLKPKAGPVDTAKEKWRKLTEIIEESSADLEIKTFLHHFWLSRYEYLPEKKLYKAFRRSVTKEKARSFLDDLVKEAVYYREVNEPAYRNWGKQEAPAKRSLEALVQFKVKQHMPMLLALQHTYRNKGVRLKDYLEALRLLERFHFLFTAVTSQRSSGGISLMYANHARKFLAGPTRDDKLQAVQELRAKLSARRPDYAEFEALFTQIRYSKQFTKQKKLVQYILESLDRHYQHGVPVDYSQMTIEHIASEKSSTDPDVIAQLGNLIFIDQSLNAELGNKSFLDKQHILTKSKAWVDPMIANAKSWDGEDIKKRTRRLAKLAYNTIWKI